MEGHNHPYKRLPPHPWDSSNCIIRCLMLWVYPLLRKGFSGNISEADVVQVIKSTDAQALGRQLYVYWEKNLMTAQVNEKSPSLFSCFWRIHKMAVLISLFLAVCSDFIFRLILVLLIPKVIDGFQTENVQVDGLLFTMLLFFVSSAITDSLEKFNTSLFTLKFQVALCSLINKKVLRLSEDDLRNFHHFRVSKLIGIECDRISKMTRSFSFLLSYCLRALVTISFLVYYFGSWSLIVICSFILINSLQVALVHHELVQLPRIMQFTEKRVNYLYRALQNMKLVKILVLEHPYIKTLLALKSKEMDFLKRVYYSRYFSILTVGFINIAWFNTVGVTMGLYTLLSTGQFFCLVALLSELRIRMQPAANSLNHIVDGARSLRQVKNFLEMADSSLLYGVKRSSNKPQISVNKLSVGWGHGAPVLVNVSFVLGNETAFLFGASGSGKSTLLKALVDEVPFVEGSIHIEGAVAYVPADPWVFKATIQQNILFGTPFCFEKYQMALEGACLHDDLGILPMSDRTVITDDNPVLTKSMRARISLARALYMNADIYLIDDLLSHMDIQMARVVFEKCVQGVLKEKTVVIVVNSLELCEGSNKVFILKEGTLEEAKDKKEVELLKLTTSPEFCHQNQSPLGSTLSLSPSNNPLDMEGIRQYAYLYRARKVPEKRWRSYYRLISRKEIRSVTIIWSISWILHFICQLSADMAMADWNQVIQTADKDIVDLSNTPRNKYIRYGVLTVTSVILGFTSAALLVILVSKLLWAMHGKAISNLFYAKLHILEAESTGTIINGFWKELEVLDNVFLLALVNVLIGLTDTGNFLVVGMMIKPVTILVFLCFFVSLHFLRAAFVQASAGVRRIQSIYMCQLMTRLNSTCDGLITIRKSGREEMMDEELNDDLNLVSTMEFMKISLTSWLSIVLSLLIFITFYIVLTILYHSGHDGTESYVGVFINFFIVLSFSLPQLFHCNVDLNQAIERGDSLQHCENLPREDTDKVAIHLPFNWPTLGSIQFKNVSFVRRANNPVPLTNFNYLIQSNEIIGIVSTTEVERSSIVAALLRVYPFEGNIFIDGVNIQDIHIHDLRSRISVISKKPLIFDGSIKFNVDPSFKYGDAEIMAVLEEVNLKDTVLSFPCRLSENITGEDCRLTAGQKKLLCLARAMLQRNRILILDGSLYDLDENTRKIIKRKLRSFVKGMTVILISDKLETIMECDEVLVLEEGVIKECDITTSKSCENGIYSPIKPHRGLGNARTL